MANLAPLIRSACEKCDRAKAVQRGSLIDKRFVSTVTDSGYMGQNVASCAAQAPYPLIVGVVAVASGLERGCASLSQ